MTAPAPTAAAWADRPVAVPAIRRADAGPCVAPFPTEGQVGAFGAQRPGRPGPDA